MGDAAEMGSAAGIVILSLLLLEYFLKSPCPQRDAEHRGCRGDAEGRRLERADCGPSAGNLQVSQGSADWAHAAREASADLPARTSGVLLMLLLMHP